MKHIQESIIWRRGLEYMRKLPNPKLKDLQHLDVVKCANDKIYICIDPDMLREPISRIYEFDAYRISSEGVSSLGLSNFNQNLTCRTFRMYDIVTVYRGVFVNNEDCSDFQTLWNILQEKIKFIV